MSDFGPKAFTEMLAETMGYDLHGPPRWGEKMLFFSGLSSAPGEGGEEGDLVTLADGGVPVDKFVIDGGLDNIRGEGDGIAGLEFVKELPSRVHFGFIGLGLCAAARAEECEVAECEFLFHMIRGFPIGESLLHRQTHSNCVVESLLGLGVNIRLRLAFQ